VAQPAPFWSRAVETILLNLVVSYKHFRALPFQSLWSCCRRMILWEEKIGVWLLPRCFIPSSHCMCHSFSMCLWRAWYIWVYIYIYIYIDIWTVIFSANVWYHFLSTDYAVWLIGSLIMMISSSPYFSATCVVKYGWEKVCYVVVKHPFHERVCIRRIL
jgi:hypothetical protein